MSTMLEFMQNPRRANARDRFSWRIPLRVIGYALVLSLVLAKLVFGPHTVPARGSEVGWLPASAGTD
jgi:hypothetical protein